MREDDTVLTSHEVTIEETQTTEFLRFTLISWILFGEKRHFLRGSCDNNHVQKAAMHLVDNLESKVSKMPHTITTQPT